MNYTYCESLRKAQCVDKNGNSEAADNVNNNFYTGPARMAGEGNDEDENAKPKKQIDQKTISRLQAMAMSDDEDDYGETFNCLSTLFRLIRLICLSFACLHENPMA